MFRLGLQRDSYNTSSFGKRGYIDGAGIAAGFV
jgi:hypothetical protein